MKYICKIFLTFSLIFSLIFLLTGCDLNSNNEQTNQKVTFMLDWLPNTNHTGIYVAKEMGFYEKYNIDIQILNPSEQSTIALVAAGKADLAIFFQDSLAMALDNSPDMPITAVAAVIQHNTAGLMSLKQNNITSFKDLENKTYATSGEEVELAILKQVMENENADFEKVNLYYSTVTDAISALQTNVDAVYVFEGWDAMKAKVANIEYNFLKIADYETALDFYTPIIIANNDFLAENESLVKDFLKATKEGYEYAIENPEEAAEILYKYAPEYDLEMLIESQKFLNEEYKKDEERWGYIDEERWNLFFSWLYEKGLIQNDITGFGFTNLYLED